MYLQRLNKEQPLLAVHMETGIQNVLEKPKPIRD